MPEKDKQNMPLVIEIVELEDPMEISTVEGALSLLVRWAIRRVQNDGETDKRPSGKVVTRESTKGYSHNKRKN